jgi:predicted  nucleic acid-binding Zn-ribbon protein
MPHQCVRCGTFYDDGSGEILKGCKCGGKLFFFVSNKRIDEIKKVSYKLTKDEKNQIEHDIFDLIGVSSEAQEPVVLDFESIRVLKPGKYELDLVNLFKDRPLIYKLDEGKYVIDLPESFKKIFDSGKSMKLK